MTCKINTNTEQEFSSVYLSAQAPARKKQLHTIAKSKILMEHAIVGGDFNCVENVDLDVRYPAQGGSTYANASGQTLARLIAESGMIDSYRLVHGDAKTGYSRMAHTIHTRIDHIYTQAHNSVWRWQKVHSLPDTFTGNAASDHLPVIARLALAKERPPSATEAKLNPAIFENPNTRLITKLLWTKQFEKFPPQEHGHAKAWEAAKTAVATYLLHETSELRIKDSPTTKLKTLSASHTMPSTSWALPPSLPPK
jgi:hypothetical protein